jgi:uncharacterized protein
VKSDSLTKYLVLFARPPIEGKVKTRIAETVGSRKALEIYMELLYSTIQMAEELPDEINLAVSWADPNPKSNMNQRWFQMNQPDSDLGTRMYETIKHLIKEKNADQVILIGADCPYIEKNDILLSFDNLYNSSTTLGPSEDGGYYLVGANGDYPELFPKMEWGRSDVLENTTKSLKFHSISTTLLRTLNDIDNIDDYLSWKDQLS